jgi:hypothetical protein
MSARREVGLLFRVGVSSPERVSPADGRKFSLEELQKFVGGYIEHVPNSRPNAYCNEDGRLQHLPLNEIASDKFQQALVGDVIQVRTEVA